jgi:hypothetical protein
MAVMLETHTLRKEPQGGMSGEPLNIGVERGTEVEVLAEKGDFVEIRVPGLPGAPVGWVLSEDVDKTSAKLPPLDLKDVASVVTDHAESLGLPAHFLLACAHMRSGLVPGRMDNGVEQGPFGFSPAEWTFFSDRPEMGLSFPAEAISEWRSQSRVSAMRMLLTLNLIAEALGRQPTAAELALAFMCGPKTAAAIISDPSKTAQSLIDANSAEDTQSAGVDRPNMNLRFGEFLAGQTGKAALDKVSAKLRFSLSATRPSIEALGGTVAGGAASSIGSSAKASVNIDISDEDMDALARVAMSEVSVFEKFGDDQLKGGAEAVADTVLNRVAHIAYPDSIQGVIDQPLQFSAINKIKSWTRLPKASQKVGDFIDAHIARRLAGESSIIKGAVNFLNPKSSSPGPMAAWGNFVVKHEVRHFGDPNSLFVHYHGTRPGGGKPRDYLLRRGGLQAHFDPDGVLIAENAGGVLGAGGPAGNAHEGGAIQDRIIALCLAEFAFFKNGKAKEDDDPQFLRIGEYWKVVGENFDGRSKIKGDKPGTMINPAWSSAFISFIVKNAGGGDRFKYSQAHSNYVQDFVAGRPGGLYEAMRPERYAPVPGDIVHSGREAAINFDFDAAQERFKADKRYASHSDFVISVDRTAGTLTTIGGNVGQSVKEKTLGLNADGTLKNRIDGGRERPWIAVLRCLG